MIDKNSTAKYIQKSNNKIIVHRGTFDRISEILKNKKFKYIKYISFSDGFPFFPMHGDSYIIFNRNKMIKKYDFLKIEYDKKFFKNKDDLLQYLMENKSKEELKKFYLNFFRHRIELLKNLIPKINNNERIMYMNEVELIKERIEEIQNDPIPYHFDVIKNENEIVTHGPVDFKTDDVEYVIYSSKQFEKFYPCPKEYKNKIDYMDHYFPVTLIKNSPLYIKINEKIKLLDNSGATGIDESIFILHHTLEAIITNPDWICDVVLPPFRFNKIPLKWHKIIRNIHFLNNDEFKVEIIDYLFRVYLLNHLYYKPEISIENKLYDKSNEILKKYYNSNI